MENSHTHRLRLCCPIDYYLPGYKAGGALRTLANIVEQLGEEVDFQVITRNHDYSDTSPYYGGRTITRKVGFARVQYLRSDSMLAVRVARAIWRKDYDLLYVQSLFSPLFSIIPILIHMAKGEPARSVVVAPRGELMLGALAQHSGRKRIFLRAIKMSSLHTKCLWQASNREETEAITDRLGIHVEVVHFPDPHERLAKPRTTTSRGKRAGAATFVFISRIDPKKGLLAAVRAVKKVEGAELDIYGPVSDERYRAAVASEIRSDSSVRFRGILDREGVATVLASADGLVLPSLGENFGHIVGEALSLGCPVISTTLPAWRLIAERGAGFEVPVGDLDALTDAISRIVWADSKQLAEMRDAAIRVFETENAARSNSLLRSFVRTLSIRAGRTFST